LGGVQLLVRALQLLVARQRLLVPRLPLLVRRLELLDGRLQVLAVRSQLPLELANARSLAPGGRPAVSLARRASAWRPTLLGLLLEEDEEVHLRADGERDDLHAQVAPVVIRLDAQALLADRHTPCWASLRAFLIPWASPSRVMRIRFRLASPVAASR